MKFISLIGWPRLKWVVTDSKYLTKPSKDWQPHIPTANTDPAYIEVTELLTGQLLEVNQSLLLKRLYCITVWLRIVSQNQTIFNLGTLKADNSCILV